MRLLFAIPHYFGQGPSCYGSCNSSQKAGRLDSLRTTITALHQQFGSNHTLLLDAAGNAKAVNNQMQHHVDIVLCVTGSHHLVRELELPEQSFQIREVELDDPRYLGFSSYDVFREKFGSYDWYCYLEDDIVIGDPLFFCKLEQFYQEAANARYLLQPNRYELDCRPPGKSYVDGPLWSNSAEFLAAHRLPGCRNEILVPFGQHTYRMVLAENPHSGCFFLTATHMQHLLEQPWYGERVAGYAGPLESAATQYLMTLFNVFKPADECASFLEVHHHFQKYVAAAQQPASDAMQQTGASMSDQISTSLWLEDLQKPGRAETHKSWFRTDTVDYWRHERMYDGVFKGLAHTKEAKWLTVGDGRYGLDAVRMIQQGFQNVTATDMDDTLLKLSCSAGLLKHIQIENAECLSFTDKSYDYVLCKESYHHFRRPMLALYEMLRVARKAVVLIEPQDPYIDLPIVEGDHAAMFEDEGNYVYSLSRRELEKMALGLSLPAIAWKNFCDIYVKGAENERADESNPVFMQLVSTINEREARCARNEDKYTTLKAIVFLELPDERCIHALQQEGWMVRLLPTRDHIA